MRDTIYLILEKTGAVGIRKGRPNLNAGQVAVRLQITISDGFFDRFIPDVSIDIPDGAVLKPQVAIELPDGEEAASD